MTRCRFTPLVLCLGGLFAAHAADPPEFRLVGDWEVEVKVSDPAPLVAKLRVAPAHLVRVEGERYDAVPVFNPNTGGWLKGVQLRGVQAQETTSPSLLVPDSFALRSGTGPDAVVFKRGQDYEIDPVWGTLGLTTNSSVKAAQPVYASYQHSQMRLDAVVLTADRRLTLRQGQPCAAAPATPKLAKGERLLGHIWLPHVLARLGSEHLFPVLETGYPEPPQSSPTPAERFLPKTMKKLAAGERLRILAWGDSVTVGTYVPDWERNRWQEQFVARLKARFPQANVELVTEAWGGRNTGTYLAEPPGSEHNFREKVLGAKPDLIVSEFVNDAGYNPEQVEAQYGRLLADFQSIGAEWVILTPHYVRPDWMGLNREREVDDDPRPYVAGLRQFALKHSVALADASRRYGRLWRQGIPYNTLMLNAINHPNVQGMTLFADALMELFP